MTHGFEHIKFLHKQLREKYEAKLFLAGYEKFDSIIWNDNAWDDKITLFKEDLTKQELLLKYAAYSRTLKQCAFMITKYEIKIRKRFEWIIRLRTDGFYYFQWSTDSNWKAKQNVIFTTHCMNSQHDFNNPKGASCSKKSKCLSDQFAIMSRDVMNFYFDGFYESQHLNNIPIANECILASKLHNVSFKSLCVSTSANMSNSKLQINWGPIRYPKTINIPSNIQSKYFIRFPLSCEKPDSFPIHQYAW